jgi:hypothetical protein
MKKLFLSRSTNLYINPSFGKAIKDNLVLGFDINYGHSLSQPDTVNKSTQNSFGAGIFVRRYKPLGNGFYLFGQSELSGSFNHTKFKNTNGNPGYDENHNDGYNFTLQFYPGIAYAINRRWQIETSLPNFLNVNYSHASTKTVYANAPEQKGSSNSFGFSSSLTGSNQFAVGVRYIIGS